MIPGIDPKVDIAFKKLFGSEQHRNLTISLIDAVLDPPPWQRLVELQLLNPYTQQMTIDDKLSVLDIKARDDQGRLFNVEMQMVAHQALPERLLYYWARLHTQQLTRGDNYPQLCPTISICFVNSTLFPPSEVYHRHFELRDASDGQTLTGHLQVHVLEIPNFQRTLADLQKPLDFWLYFLKNGVELDADALPEPLDTDEMRQVMEVLKVYSQDEMEREIYEGRLKAEHDAATWEYTRRETARMQAEIARMQAEIEKTQAEIEKTRAEIEKSRAEIERGQAKLEKGQADLERGQAEMARRRADLERGQAEIVRSRAEMERSQAEMERSQAEMERQRVEAEQLTAKAALAGQIQMCERLLGRPVTDWNQLVAKDQQDLQATSTQLERLLTRAK